MTLPSRIMLVVTLAWPLTSHATPNPRQVEELTVCIGGQRLLHVVGESVVRVENEDVVEARSLGGDVLVTGLTPGRSQVQVAKDGRYLIEVRECSVETLRRELTPLIEAVDGLSLRVVGDRLYVEGEAVRLTEEEEAAFGKSILQRFPGIRWMVPTPPTLQRTLRRAVAGLGLEHVIVRGSPWSPLDSRSMLTGWIRFEGSVRTAEELELLNHVIYVEMKSVKGFTVANTVVVSPDESL